jgi:phosphoglycerate dehydrogenase-like enzyme
MLCGRFPRVTRVGRVTTICLPDAQAQEMVGAVPGADIVVWDGTATPPDTIDAVQFLVAGYGAPPMSPEALARMPRLTAIQLLSAGVENWLPHVPAGVALCSGRGVHGGPTAELAIAGLLAVLRELPRFAYQQQEGVWRPHPVQSLDGRRVLVLGAGDIGQRVAAMVRLLGAEPTLVGRHERDGVRPLDELSALLPEHDVLVVALPLTDDTAGLVDSGVLAALPDGAVLVNVARGRIVDTAALLAELQRGRLRAFLDVTDPEPLPADHPLWAAPGVLITPHVGGGTPGWAQRAYRLVREQIVRFVAGEPLRNVVTDGY